MKHTLAEITEQAMKLSPKQRIMLAKRMLASLQASDRHDLLWGLEADRRYQDILSGKAKTIPGEEVIAEMEALLAAPVGSASDSTKKPGPNSRKP
jgi:hypothetical protein